MQPRELKFRAYNHRTDDMLYSFEAPSMSDFFMACELAKGDKLEGPRVTMQMAKDEGWISKSGSKWKTMPDLMIRYRAASFWGRLYVPDIMMGMHTVEEVEDTEMANQNNMELKRQIANNAAQAFQKP